MHVTVLGGTGATGRLLLPTLERHGHSITAVARDPGRLPAGTVSVTGDVRDAEVLREALEGAQAVVSALGPRKGEQGVHGAMVRALVPTMQAAGVRRYVGISGAGMDAPGDHKSRRDAAISKVMQTLGRATVADKRAELDAWLASDLDWTLVRPPRLTDGPATGAVEHHAHESCRSTRLSRADLVEFLVEVLEEGLYLRQAPLVAQG